MIRFGKRRITILFGVLWSIISDFENLKNNLSALAGLSLRRGKSNIRLTLSLSGMRKTRPWVAQFASKIEKSMGNTDYFITDTSRQAVVEPKGRLF
jgi:hypothetical protein